MVIGFSLRLLQSFFFLPYPENEKSPTKLLLFQLTTLTIGTKGEHILPSE